MTGRLLPLALVALTGCSNTEGTIDDGCGYGLVACGEDGAVFAPDTEWDGEASADTAIEPAPDSAIIDTAPDSGPSLDRSKCTKSPDAKGLVTRAVPGGSGTYLSYVPASYDPKTSTALVLALHGAGDVASNYLAAVWRSNADARGFIVLVPDGSCAAGPGNTWCGGDGKRIADALDDLEACYSIDPKRRIVDGFSAGGIIAYALGLQNAAAFAGISISAADLGSAEALVGGKLLPAAWKVPVSHHHGVSDGNFPIAYARAGRDRLIAAGHPVSWHEFEGGHTTNAAFALVRFDDLSASRAP